MFYIISNEIIMLDFTNFKWTESSDKADDSNIRDIIFCNKQNVNGLILSPEEILINLKENIFNNSFIFNDKEIFYNIINYLDYKFNDFSQIIDFLLDTGIITSLCAENLITFSGKNNYNTSIFYDLGKGGVLKLIDYIFANKEICMDAYSLKEESYLNMIQYHSGNVLNEWKVEHPEWYKNNIHDVVFHKEGIEIRQGYLSGMIIQNNDLKIESSYEKVDDFKEINQTQYFNEESAKYHLKKQGLSLLNNTHINYLINVFLPGNDLKEKMTSLGKLFSLETKGVIRRDGSEAFNEGSSLYLLDNYYLFVDKLIKEGYFISMEELIPNISDYLYSVRGIKYISDEIDDMPF